MNYNLVIMNNFGQWLLQHRTEAKMTQGAVAKKAGVSVSYVSTLEREQPHSITGAKLTPEPDKVIALAKAVGGDENEALDLCGYAAKNNILPEELRDIPFTKLYKEQLIAIREFILYMIDKQQTRQPKTDSGIKVSVQEIEVEGELSDTGRETKSVRKGNNHKK